jgi:hypothetical protein
VIDAIFRPLEKWPGTPTANLDRRASPFKATYQDTMDLLERELAHLAAVNIVIHCEVERSQLRNDGWMKADTRVAGPAVIVAFKAAGELYSYPCDTFTEWKANLRAIALSLEALRKIDRYGVTSRGEQYQGFRALPAAERTRTQITPEAAAAFIAGKVPGVETGALLASKPLFEAIFKLTQKSSHPDAGGSNDDFVRLQEAGGVLTTYHKAAGA